MTKREETFYKLPPISPWGEYRKRKASFQAFVLPTWIKQNLKHFQILAD